MSLYTTDSDNIKMLTHEWERQKSIFSKGKKHPIWSQYSHNRHLEKHFVVTNFKILSLLSMKKKRKTLK